MACIHICRIGQLHMNYLYLVLLTMVCSTRQQVGVRQECNVNSNPAVPTTRNPDSVLSIETGKNFTGQHFVIVNSNTTLSVTRQFGTGHDRSPHDILEHTIDSLDNVDQYLSKNVSKSCRITTFNEQTCLSVVVDRQAPSFIGLFEVYLEHATEIEVARHQNDDNCTLGRVRIQSAVHTRDVTHFCSLDSGAAATSFTLGPNSVYYLSYEAARTPPVYWVLFAIPLSASPDVLIECGIEPPTRTPSNPIPPVPGSTTTTPTPRPQPQSDKSGEDTGLKTEMIAIIAVLGAVVIAAIVLGVLLLIYCRRTAKADNQPYDPPATQPENVDPYEQVNLTLAKDNPYQPDPTSHTYERINSLTDNTNHYAEIPADAMQDGDTNSECESVLQTDSQSNSAVSPLPSTYATLPTSTLNNITDHTDLGTTNPNVEDLYSKPHKLPKQQDSLVENDVYQSGSTKQTHDIYETVTKPDSSTDTVIEVNGKDKIEPQDSIVRMVDNDLYNSD